MARLVLWAVLAGLLLLGIYGLWAAAGSVARTLRHGVRTARECAQAVSLKEVEKLLEQEDAPRSLNACDSIYLPQLREEFPGFDPGRAKALAEEYLTAWLEKQQYVDIGIHRTVISDYRRHGEDRALVFQTAAAYRERAEAHTVQGRFETVYSYRTKEREGEAVRALTCPQCGGALPERGAERCGFCGSLLAHAPNAAWSFTACRPC